MTAQAPSLAFAVTARPWGALWRAELPPGLAGGWASIAVITPAARCWIKLEFTDLARGQVVREVFLRPPRRHRGGEMRASLVHVPAASRSVELHIYGDQPTSARLLLRRSGRVATAWRLLRDFAPLVPGCLRGTPLGLVGRIRAVLGQAPARAGDVPPYAAWIALFEAPQPPPAGPYAGLDVLILAQSGSETDLARSRDSVAGQGLAPGRCQVIRTQAEYAAACGVWAVLLAPGEILHPHALAWFAATIAANPGADAVIADADRWDAAGGRCDPLFKPGADRLLLGGGLLAVGACALRLPPSDELALRGASESGKVALTALALRQSLLESAGEISHVARVLTHCPEVAPTLRAATARSAARTGGVTAIIPSRAADWHVARCIAAVQRKTEAVALKIIVALAQPAQAKTLILARLRRIPGVTLAALDLPAFNYAQVNNLAARAVDSEFLLLLNDDVVPIDGFWLSHMLAQMDDPRTGIVGARLLYGNGMVQHAGVILGLANLAEHAGRLAAGANQGPHGLWRTTRQVSAVTAACLLIRTSLFRELGGMDENYVIALNDVDLCLRARALGHRVVYCAEAQLNHYESLSLGRHYGGARAVLEAVETQRLRHSWGPVIAADPFYNPQASLQPGREWQPAFPPRGPGFPDTHANLPERS